MNNLIVGHRLHGDGLLRQSVKEPTPTLGGSAIEAESEVVEVVIQTLVTHRSLMSPHQPAPQQRHHSVHSGQELGRVFFLAAKRNDLMDATFHS
jgi:hypothetical protein